MQSEYTLSQWGLEFVIAIQQQNGLRLVQLMSPQIGVKGKDKLGSPEQIPNEFN